MSQVRRSARIAAKNAAKASSKSVSKPNEPSPAFLNETPSPISDCHIQYVIYPIDSDIENPEVLKELIARHW